ncbi:MAG: hypothetical protein C0392_03280 [Syntrophus sp. (in: bacteria)]|nr:hypothetical protein [Syntrophus sp. (in: bacteria)]
MKARPAYQVKEYMADGSIEEIKIWQIPRTEDKPHGLKYSFVYIVANERVIGYDNFEGKGDHRHYEGKEYAYAFENLEKLWHDFKEDVQRFKEDIR